VVISNSTFYAARRGTWKWTYECHVPELTFLAPDKYCGSSLSSADIGYLGE
jgi:hypothetical protein